MLFNRPRATALMRSAGVDAVVATSKENVAYLTGHDSPTHTLMKNSLNFALFTPDADPIAAAIIPRLEIETWLQCDPWMDQVWVTGVFNRGTGHGHEMDRIGKSVAALLEAARAAPDTITALRIAIEERRLERTRIAVDETGLTFRDWSRLSEIFPEAEIVPGNSLLWAIRMIKTDDEIARLRRSSAIAEEGVRAALAHLRPGVTDAAIARAYNASVCHQGGLPTFAMFGGGVRSAQPHFFSTDDVIEAGDLVRWDVGCTVGLYHADTARAVVVGDPQPHQSRIWDLLVQGVEDAIALIRPGADPAAIHTAAMAPLERSGNDGCARFHCGHGVGIAIYDPPIVTRDDPAASVFRVPAAEGGLQPGMVLNIEVGYYQQGFQGFLCEDTILVTADGHERLTHAPKALALDSFLA